jgi:flagellar biosynthesis protein FlhB
MAEDLGERTEQPTPKRRADARRKGNVPRSQELSGALLLLVGTLMVMVAFFPMLAHFKGVIEAVLAGDTLGNPVDPKEARTVIDFVAVAAARIGVPLLLVMAAAAFAVSWSWSRSTSTAARSWCCRTCRPWRSSCGPRGWCWTWPCAWWPSCCCWVWRT